MRPVRGLTVHNGPASGPQGQGLHFPRLRLPRLSRGHAVPFGPAKAEPRGDANAHLHACYDRFGPPLPATTDSVLQIASKGGLNHPREGLFRPLTPTACAPTG